MERLRVIDWIDDSEIKNKSGVGSLGGWFDETCTYKDYLKGFTKKGRKYISAIAREVIKEDLKITGEEHQNGTCPLFNDGTSDSFSFRAWGDLMAAIHQFKNKKPYHYMDFYYTYFEE